MDTVVHLSNKGTKIQYSTLHTPEYSDQIQVDVSPVVIRQLLPLTASGEDGSISDSDDWTDVATVELALAITVKLGGDLADRVNQAGEPGVDGWGGELVV